MVIRTSVQGLFLRWFGGSVPGRIWNIFLEALVSNDDDRSDDEDCAANKEDHHPA
jgi:hypothetical protein